MKKIDQQKLLDQLNEDCKEVRLDRMESEIGTLMAKVDELVQWINEHEKGENNERIS